MRVTIKDIARELGLSESAVSLALNQRPGVSDTTRQRVISCARSLGYNRGHLRAHQEQSRTVLVAHYQKRIHTPVDFFSTLLSNAERELRKSGISLVSTVIDAGQNVIEQLEHHVDKGCTGVIVLATEMDEGDWHPFSQLHLPVVLLDTYLATAEASCVTIHNREGARQATQLLLSEGRGCPGFLGASLPLLNFKEREEGFLSAIQDAGYGTALAQRLILSPYVEGAEIDLSLRYLMQVLLPYQDTLPQTTTLPLEQCALCRHTATVFRKTSPLWALITRNLPATSPHRSRACACPLSTTPTLRRSFCSKR